MKIGDFTKIDSNLKILSSKDDNLEVGNISALEDLSDKCLVFVKNNKFLQKLLSQIERKSFKSVAIIDEKLWLSVNDLQKQLIHENLKAVLTSNNIALSLTLISKPFYIEKTKNINFHIDGRQMGTCEIHPSAFIAQGVFIGENVTIGENVNIASGCVILPHSSIGTGTFIYPNVTIYPWSKIGKNVRIHSGVIVGSDGFGYTFHQGQHLKIWHTGGVEIDDDVEIGSNCTIDMGTFSPTRIGQGTRIDNSVQIAHNVKIGKHCVLCGQSGVAGSAILEDFVVLGGKSGVAPDAYLGQGTLVAGGALVNDGAIWPAGSKLGGHPARDLKEWMKTFAYLRKVSLTKE